MRVALAHDWLVGYRGGEAVLEGIARVLGARADEITGVYTMFDGGGPVAPRIDRLARIAPAWGRGRLCAGVLRRWMLPLYPRAVAWLSARLAADARERPIDLLVSTSSAAIKGLRAPAGVPHVCYCHTPARYLWSQGAEYGRGALGGLRTLGLRAAGARLRAWDVRATAGVTVLLANSTHTRREIERCYAGVACAAPGRVRVVHPPVRTGYFTPAPAGFVADAQASGAWLVAGALEPYKRVDLALAAARLAGRRLVVAGTGSQERALRAAAGPEAVFLGRVGDARLRDLMRSAEALLMPQVEDFGIVACEALACGLPVVARRAGGALDIVEDGVSGVLFDEASAPALAAACARVPRGAAGACRERAERFGESRFDDEVRAVLDEVTAAGARGNLGKRSA